MKGKAKKPTEGNLNQLYNIFLKSTGICTDSRKAGTGEIFFALQGENFDGNRYAENALEKGCSHAIIDNASFLKDDRYILTENCLNLLQELASFHRSQLNIPIIAITGSNGKTTTKELVAVVLAKKFKTYATKGNLNNHIGVPLSILEIREEEIAIIEMGANHIGEIEALCTIADPNYGVITNIGRAHLEGFGSPEGVVKAKTELYRHLEKRSGTIFLNGNNALIVREALPLNVEKYSYMSGTNLLCNGYAEMLKLYMSAVIKFTKGREYKFPTSFTGTYNLENILAAACIGKYFDVNEEDIVNALSTYTPSNNRSQLLETGKNTLIMDAYNANPVSMEEAINNFLKLEHPKKTMILGDMLELGDWSEQEHLKVVEKIHESGFKDLFLVGPCFRAAASAFAYPGFDKVEDLIEYLSKNPINDHLILLKGSRGVRLEKVGIVI